MADQDLDRWTLDRIRTTLDRSESITVEDARWLIDKVAAARTEREQAQALARDIVTGHGAQLENLDMTDDEWRGSAVDMFGPEYEEHFEITMRFDDWLALLRFSKA